MTERYSSVTAVRTRTAVDPQDLGLETDEELTAFIEELLGEVSDLMNTRLKRNYMTELDAGDIETIPKGLHGIAADIASDSLREMVATRQTPVVRIDDFAVRTIQSRIFTNDITQRLKLYGRSHGSIDQVPGHIAPTARFW